MILFVELTKGTRQDKVTKIITEVLSNNLKNMCNGVGVKHIDTLTRNGYRTLVYNVNVNPMFTHNVIGWLSEGLGNLKQSVSSDLKIYVETIGIQNEQACNNVMNYCESFNRNNKSANSNNAICGKSSSKNGVITLSVVIKNISDALYKQNGIILNDIYNLNGVSTVYIS